MKGGLVTLPPMTPQNKPASADNTTYQLHDTPNGDDQAAERTFRSTDFHFASFDTRFRTTRFKISSYLFGIIVDRFFSQKLANVR